MWLYKNNEIKTLEDFGEITPFGFVYITTHTPTNKKYLGKKSLFHTLNKKLGKKELAQQPITRGRNKSTKQIIKESDWKSYYGSAEYIKSLIKSDKQNELTREIIDVAFDKKHLTYLETKYLFMCGVLEKPEEWINDNIQGRFFTKDFTELNQIKNLEKQAKDFVFEYGKIKIQ
jgi:hypothetical protein